MNDIIILIGTLNVVLTFNIYVVYRLIKSSKGNGLIKWNLDVKK